MMILGAIAGYFAMVGLTATIVAIQIDEDPWAHAGPIIAGAVWPVTLPVAFCWGMKKTCSALLEARREAKKLPEARTRK